MMGRLVITAVCFALLSGCSLVHWPTRPSEQGSDNRIAENFAHVFNQVVSPNITSVTVPDDANGLLLALKSELLGRGYTVNSQESGRGERVLIAPERSETNSHAYSVMLDTVVLTRRYQIDALGAYPVSPMQVYGAGRAFLSLNDEIFGQVERDGYISGIVHSDSIPESMLTALASSEAGWVGRTELSNSDGNYQSIIPASVAGSTDLLLDTPGFENSDGAIEGGSVGNQTPADTDTDTDTRQNMLTLGRSNYSEIFKGREVFRQTTLQFPDDSLTMGNHAKTKLNDFLRDFDPVHHIISVVGCSHGTTRLENGNEVLAMGRAERVREELLYARVPAEKIFDEGCWAGQSVINLPARGVIVMLYRNS